MAKASRAEWVKRVERWQDSGLTAKEFAAELAVSRKWKLRREHSTQGGTSCSKTRKPVVKEPTFLQLVPTTGDAVGAAVPLELVLRGDIVVRVAQGFDEQTLTRVLRALGAR